MKKVNTLNLKQSWTFYERKILPADIIDKFDNKSKGSSKTGKENFGFCFLIILLTLLAQIYFWIEVWVLGCALTQL